jgi:ankyrin repeat protein
MSLCSSRYFTHIPTLIKAGADFTHQDNNGMTVFHIACQYADLFVILELLEQLRLAIGTTSLVDSNGNTPLHYFVRRSRIMYGSSSYLIMMENLMEHGISPHLTNREGATALHLLWQSEGKKWIDYCQDEDYYLRATELFINKGLRLVDQDRLGRIPLDYIQDPNFRSKMIMHAKSQGWEVPDDTLLDTIET